jgi:hypothetical protein
MPDPSPFDLATLLLPEPQGRLLVVGNHASLHSLTDEPWDQVVFAEHLDRPNDPANAAVLFAGAPPTPTHDVPTAAIFKSSSGPRTGATIVRDAHPPFGRPLLWRSPASSVRPSRSASPRGRFDLIRLDLLGYLEPLRHLGLGWSVSADPERSLIGRLLAAAGLIDADWQQTRSKWLIAIGETKVLKIPQQRVPTGTFAAQNRQLSTLRATLAGNPLLSLFPSDQQELHIGGWVAGLEDRLPGQSAFRSLGNSSHLTRIFRSATTTLESWYTPRPEPQTVDRALFHELWEAPLTPLADALAKQDQIQTWQQILQRLRDRATGKTLPVVPNHGDFWLNNLLVNEQTLELTGIVDWDRATPRGLPLLDLFHLLMWRTRLITPDLIPRLLRGFLKNSGAPNDELIRHHCKAIGLDPSWIPDLFCRYWLGQIAQRTGEFFPGPKSLQHLRIIAEFLAP